MELIQLKEVEKRYKKNVILQDVNLTIHEGDIIGIIGQSGSGKSTLLKLLCGFLQPTDGDVIYFSKKNHQPKLLRKNFKKIKKHLGYTPQHFSFYPKLTVKENLLHFGKLHGLDKKTLIANAKSLLHFTGLYDHRNKLSEHLSGGMQKRLDISCSLIHKPKILILDEPTADLDPLLQEDILSLIKEVNAQGVTVVIASHHLDSLERMCNKVAIIHKGNVRSYGDMDDVRKPYVKKGITINIKAGREKQRMVQLLQNIGVGSIVDQGHRLVISPENPHGALSSLLQAIQQEQIYLHDIDVRKPSLDEIFTKIVEE